VIVVDTPVWGSFLCDAKSSVRPALDRLLDDDVVLLPLPVRVELLSGAGAHTVSLLQRTLSAQGLRFGVGDLLIAACAAERGATLWTLDGDFEPLFRLRWVKRFRP
jgi:predicted nucleic acid-binding protein